MKERKEWTSPYNEFNSMKILYFKEHLQGIAKRKFLPPITTDTDPTNICNFNCVWCNSESFRDTDAKSMSPGHLIKLADFYSDWGVKSTCVSGGGEPMLNQGFPAFIERLHTREVKSGIISNGSVMNQEYAIAIAKYSSWCGISVDAGSSEVFTKIKGVTNKNMFERIISNIEGLVKAKKDEGSDLEVTYKYLIHPENAKDIYRAAKIAKSIGVNTFHLRPVCTDNLYNQDKQGLDFRSYIELIEDEITKSQELEDNHFRFYAVRHKFGENFERKLTFKKCLATPFVATFGADGNVHLCFDVRGKKEWILCRHDPDPYEVLKVWGSDKHLEIIDSVEVEKCPRCTFTQHNEIIENVILEDKMYLDFM